MVGGVHAVNKVRRPSSGKSRSKPGKKAPGGSTTSITRKSVGVVQTKAWTKRGNQKKKTNNGLVRALERLSQKKMPERKPRTKEGGDVVMSESTNVKKAKRAREVASTLLADATSSGPAAGKRSSKRGGPKPDPSSDRMEM